MNGTDYVEFKSELNYEEFYFDVDNEGVTAEEYSLIEKIREVIE
mgnify:CR=1 FL=1